MILAEETPLEDFLRGDTPCGAYDTAAGKTCGLPAVMRIVFECSCGLSWRGFACGRCLQRLQMGMYFCSRCGKTQASWTEC